MNNIMSKKNSNYRVSDLFLACGICKNFKILEDKTTYLRTLGSVGTCKKQRKNNKVASYYVCGAFSKKTT